MNDHPVVPPAVPVDTLRALVEEFTGWWGLNREGSVNRTYDYIDKTVKRLEDALASSGAVPQASGWQPIETAPKDARWIIGQMADGEVYRVHFAEDLSGSEQPAFSGWFRTGGRTSMIGCSPVRWLPIPPVSSLTAQPEREE